jgi:hypothetical protein
MHKTRLLRGLAVASALLVGLAGLANVARADKVGVAAAVNPDAFSTLAGAPQTQLNIGKSIFFNERINSTGSGLVQVLLVDGSTFTVGPGSDLVIDKFVHNPSKGTGRDCRHQHHDGLLQQSFCVRAIQAALNLSPQFNLGFGGNGRSAFIDDKNFAATEGVIGNFGVGNSSCQATGIFGGTAQPH